MPAAYHAVSAAVWTRAFRGISRDAQVLGFYVWTNRSRSSEGLYHLPVPQITGDTKLDEEAIVAAFGELDGIGYASYDLEAEVVLDHLALQTQPLRSAEDKRVRGAVRIFGSVPETRLKACFLDLARRHSPALADAILEEYGDLHPEAPSKPLRRPSEAPSDASREKRGERASSSNGQVDLCVHCGEQLDEWDLPPEKITDAGPMHHGCAVDAGVTA